MTLFRATVIDTPHDPFTGGELRADDDAGLLVRDGAIVARGAFGRVRSEHPEADVVDLREGVLLPGFVDAHVHYPQVRAIGGLGMPLLDWLERCSLPEEARLADVGYARGVAADFVAGLVEAGTTSAMVFGAHYAAAMDELFTAGADAGLRITSGLVVSDRILREDLLTSPERAVEESIDLAGRWHGKGRLRYAVTPRFSLSCTDEMLAACASVLADVPGAWFTSHVNENRAEVAEVERLFDGEHYVGTYDRHHLLSGRAVLAHDVHPREEELGVLAAHGTSVAHCPTSNASLASGLFPLRRHVEAGVHVALGSDVGGGTGFPLLKEGLQAYFAQQLLADDGYPLTPAHLLHLATSAGATALGLSEEVGDLGVGKRFDAVLVRPRTGTTLDVGLRHAGGPDDAVAKLFALAGPADIERVWVDGQRVDGRQQPV